MQQVSTFRQSEVAGAICQKMRDVPASPKPEDEIESVQLLRLAEALLNKTPDDFRALLEVNPGLVHEWHQDFRRQRQHAETLARQWQAAEAALAIMIRRAMAETQGETGDDESGDEMNSPQKG